MTISNLVNIIWLLIAIALNPATDPKGKKKLKKEISRHITYLASDELKGRGIGTQGIDEAAEYIASYFKKVGLKPVKGNNEYFQEFELVEEKAPESINLHINDLAYRNKKDLVLLNGDAITLNHVEVVFVEFGSDDEIQHLDLKGKILLTRMGYRNKETFESYYTLMDEKRESIRKSGALALIEIYKSKQVSWQQINQYFSESHLTIPDPNQGFIHLFLSDSSIFEHIDAEKNNKAALSVKTVESKKIKAKNVIGYIEGTDPSLTNEYILLGAHYDHVGIGRPAKSEDGILDSIYNGARDNAAGTVAVMMAAKELAQAPPKRPVLFIAFTAEESGLLGSKYYADHPSIPLGKIAFYFNNDNGGYNDTGIATVVGATRSNVKSVIDHGIKQADLSLFTSNSLEEVFFGLSDNISLSVKGVPSASYSLGFTAMDNEIKKYYHQPGDEAESMDMGYVAQWIDGYINAALNIANMNERPFWNAGDEFEEIGKKLYQLD